MTRIIIIDDSPEDREWLTDCIEQAGDYTVTSYAQASDGIAEIKEKGADCVLVDNRLDGEDGLAVLAAIKRTSMFTPVIIMTGQGNEELASTALLAGASYYLRKQGQSVETLEKAIREAIKDNEEYRIRVGIKSKLKHVLLVEDNDEDRDQLEDMILAANGGVTVTAVATGTEALKSFQENKTDCVILDYRLEAEDGIDVLASLKEISPFTPVIMLTGQGNEEVAATSIKSGAADYLVKQRLTETSLRISIENGISRSALEEKVADQESQRRQFLNILVHDLKAPLRNVSYLNEIAAEHIEEDDSAELKNTLALQTEVARRANDLIASLESYALLDVELTFAPVSLSAVARAAADNLAAIIRDRNARVVVGDLPVVHGNEPQIMQLFQNLIGNGLKYNNSEPPEITIESRTPTDGSDAVLIVVRDNGIGIPANHLKTVFAPLMRLWVPEQYEGTGLGLSICQKIADRHGGSIWCTSEKGKGSSFFVKLPRLAVH